MVAGTVDTESTIESRRLDEVLAFPVFSVHERIVTWGTFLAQVAFLGQLDDLLEAVCEERRALRSAQQKGTPIEPEAAQEIANQVRYHHNLITAEETAAWLEERHLDVGDLNDFVAASLLRGKAEALLDVEPAETLSCEALARLLWVEVNLRDLWPELLPGVARRFLVEELRLNEQTFEPVFLERAKAAYSERQVTEEAVRCFVADSLEELFRREANYLQYCELIANEENCQRRLAALRPELYSVEFELAYFGLHDVASEAYLCASVDSEPMEALCARAGGDYERRREVIEDVEEELRSYLISARAGEVMQPFAAAEGGYYLLYLLTKEEPRLASESIRGRVRRRLVIEAFAPYIEQHIGWP